MPGSVPCPACGSAVPAGRLACPSCGTLVASMATAILDPDAASTTEPELVPDPATPVAAPAADDEPVASLDTDAESPASIDEAVAAMPAAAALVEGDGPIDDPDVAADGLASGGIVPGAYLPPSTVHRAGPPIAPGGPALAPRAAPVDSLAWPATIQPSASSLAASSVPPSLGATASQPFAAPPPEAPPAATPWMPPVAPMPAPAPTRDGRPIVPGRASILADLPFDAPDELEGWLVVLGGATAILGFLLPWRSAVSTGLDGYLASWGLGIGTNLPILILVLVATGLSIFPNRVAGWFRHGVLGMVAGGVLFGLVWLYIAGGGGELGAILAAVGAVLLIGGGVIAVSPSRTNPPSAER